MNTAAANFDNASDASPPRDRVPSAAARRSGPIWPRAVRWSGTAVVCAWAAFWTWFCFNVAMSEGGQSWLYGGGVILVSLGIAAATVRWPRIGGALAVGAGVFSFWFFPGADAALLMACPPIIGGMLAAAGAWMGRGRG
ncbi:MAG: hypothetical protein KF869_00825 [Phycisphaeraceae bacterium]|nr:hypothetical protein [Phycisphaeraceae bacterium]